MRNGRSGSMDDVSKLVPKADGEHSFVSDRRLDRIPGANECSIFPDSKFRKPISANR
jgi:hypothetical protein